MIDWPIAIFMIGTLFLTAAAAWGLRALIAIGRAAANFPKEHTP